MTRSEHFQLRLTPDEKAQLHRLADEAGIDASTLIRQRVGLGEKSDEESIKRLQEALDPPMTPKAVSPEGDAFDRRVKELSRTLPNSTARRIATQELS